jgi:hypothetical protein
MRNLTAIGILAFCAAGIATADTLTLRSGETVRGTYLGGTARQVRMDVNGNIQSYDIGQVQSISFTDADVQAQAPPPMQRRGFDSAPPPRDRGDDRNAGYSSAGITLPADTAITVRMIDSVDSQTARLGQTFKASLDEPVFMDGREVIPRGADVMTKLVTDTQAGKIQGRTVLTLALSSIMVNGRMVDVTSTDVRQESSSRGSRSAKVIGGTAALGAIIGGIAGGGKGAAIGAGSGAAVGTGAEVLTGGQRVRIPSETRLTFRLQTSVQI